MKLLHIYAQAWEHSDAWIVGNREGLTALRDALNRTLEGKMSEPSACLQFAADGEGYACFVAPNDADWQHETWTKLYFPYTDETAKDRRKDEEILCPHQILGSEAYERLYEGLKKREP